MSNDRNIANIKIDIIASENTWAIFSEVEDAHILQPSNFTSRYKTARNFAYVYNKMYRNCSNFLYYCTVCNSEKL